MSINTKPQRRFPSKIYSSGIEPDPRFILANERTYLAWIRTSIALIAAGVALQTFALSVNSICRLSASLMLILVGLFIPINAWFGWAAIERALRLSLPLPNSPIAIPVAAAVTIAGLLIIAGVLLQ